ncbi:MAG: prepilin peptidase [Eubacterium sp.]|nr:prepilin peptidase [Eubacterium sp.]
MLLWQNSQINYFYITVILLVVFLLGITAFSYVNQLVLRIPAGESLIVKNSTCPRCGHPRRLKDDIPLFSYLFTGGKCAYCFERLGLREPLVELVGGLAAVGIVFYYGLTWSALTVFLLYGVLMTISLIDYDTMEIPLGLNVTLLGLSAISFFTMEGPGVGARLIGMVCISGFMFLVVLLVPGGFGGGDIKMMTCVGFFLGWKAMVAAFFIALLLGGGYGIYVMASGKKGRKEHFALGPALAVGVAISVFADLGTLIVDSYLGLMIK